MSLHHFPYGHTNIDLCLPENLAVDWIEPAYVAPAPDAIEVVRSALANPVDGIPIQEMRGIRSVVIAINDKTRPVPHEHLLPPLLDALHTAGIDDQSIHFIAATGTHTPMTSEEMLRILPPTILARYSVSSHDCDDPNGLTALGTTTRGNRVTANRRFFEADLKIVVGNIEPHHFAGFSGGYKTAAIGLAGRDTITYNHALLIEPGAEIARYEDNPLRQDIEEIGQAMGVHIALNAVLNSEKKIVRAICGSPLAVMQAGIPISRAACQVDMKTQGRTGGEKYDLVIASAGGAPKDINFYQAQKALTHAALFIRPGGVIILAAACEEGVGSASYVDFMRDVHTNAEVFEHFRSLGFRVGPHKAFQVARIAERASIMLVSQMPQDVVAGLLMTPAESIDAAVHKAIDILSPAPGTAVRTAVLPRATNTVPNF